MAQGRSHNAHFCVWLINNKRSITGTELAERIDVSRVMVSRWINGHSRPTLENFNALCEILAIDDEHLDCLLLSGIQAMVTDIKYAASNRRPTKSSICFK